MCLSLISFPDIFVVVVTSERFHKLISTFKCKKSYEITFRQCSRVNFAIR